MKCTRCGSVNSVCVSLTFDPKETEHSWSFKGAKHPIESTTWGKYSAITDDMCYELSGNVPDKMVEIARKCKASHICLDVCMDCDNLIDRYGYWKE